MSAARVLCVDDDLPLLKSLTKVLEHSGFQVSAASSVPEALELIGKQAFDVLLTDLNIGEPADGFTVVGAMRRVQPRACTFIITGYPDIDSAIQAIRSQVDDYFAKPLDIPRLLDAIESARNGSRHSNTPRQSMRVSELVRRSKRQICDSWLRETLKVPELASIPLTAEERMDHLPELLDEIASRIDSPRDTLGDEAAEAARKHGRTRFQQGYTIPQILHETRVLQQVLSSTIQKDLLILELSSLVPDAFTIGESLEVALDLSIRAYQAQIPQSLQSSFSVLYKSPHLGVAIANENRILDANDAFLNMIQHSREQLRAGEIDWLRMTPERFRPLDSNALEQLREYGACVPFEKEFNLPDGTALPFLIGAVRLSTEPFQWSVYMVDLTEQRKLQSAERKVLEWESRYAFINHLAHEINNPLAALTFTLHLLETYPDLPPDARKLVSNAAEMLDRVSESVKKVLIESRPAE
jgi:ActR/RegA family two-component response regulator